MRGRLRLEGRADEEHEPWPVWRDRGGPDRRRCTWNVRGSWVKWERTARPVKAFGVQSAHLRSRALQGRKDWEQGQPLTRASRSALLRRMRVEPTTWKQR
jgi:hypothetical protein